MKLPIPNFIPTPSAETTHLISLILLSIGICVLFSGLFLLYSQKKKGSKTILSWIMIGLSLLLIINHSIQLIFSGGINR